jgi:hypothetical protein
VSTHELQNSNNPPLKKFQNLGEHVSLQATGRDRSPQPAARRAAIVLQISTSVKSSVCSFTVELSY